jgi:hypothetical protein
MYSFRIVVVDNPKVKKYHLVSLKKNSQSFIISSIDYTTVSFDAVNLCISSLSENRNSKATTLMTSRLLIIDD